MAKQRIEEPRIPRPRGPWTDRVEFAEAAPFAFRPNQIIAAGEDSLKIITELIREQDVSPNDIQQQRIFDENWLIRAPIKSVEELVASARRQGVRSEPNYVLFLHSGPACGRCGGGCSCGHGGLNPFTPNPFTPNPFTPNPFTPNPFTPNPFTPNAALNPFTPNPFTPNPFTPNRFASSGVRSSSAKPADDPEGSTPAIPVLGEDKLGHVIIYDTGISIKDHLPQELMDRPEHQAAPDFDRDEPDEAGDELLDPVAGHGTFIAGIIEQLAPKQDVQVSSVFSTFGDTDIATITSRLDDDLALLSDAEACRTIVNMSFGAYADEQMYLLADACHRAQSRGVVIVASAGNDSVSWPSFPATLPGVIGVASVDECGRAPYSNFGSWVRACAPGTAVVSSFFQGFNGKVDPTAGTGSVDPDDFKGWAEWTGTSFAAPIVVGAILRQMALHGQTAADAAAVVIDSPNLLSLPGLGTVVNLVPGM